MKWCIKKIIIWEIHTHIVMTLVSSFQLKQKHGKWSGLKKCSKIRTHSHKCETLQQQKKKTFQHYPILKVATLSMIPIFETRFDILTMPQDVFIVELGIFICLQVLRVTTVVVIRSKEWFFLYWLQLKYMCTSSWN